MPYLRLFLAWIVMFAVPIQGFAAASMLFCGQGTAHHAQVQVQVAAAEHNHATGTPGHDHAKHQSEAKAPADKSIVKTSVGASASNLMHKCSACATCCHAVAIAQTPWVVAPDVPGRADPGEPLMAAHSRPLLVPDKPPRA
ncbi:hypothetical protein [Ramlibacter sp. WS9]|uniref:hypothetical protein n=1 Tax=Ramlibacter sp. WS9 TaxID=1882741 RepID=UPI001142B059|nr:hypothetical protein [Ramlibacter sp. WS9]ROZ79588.1 hypothetical protein EEB15_01360 [Ramlibacter sp. WS9]